MYLGIDTSCYTSSVAIVDKKGNVVADLRLPLEVKSGEKGLRQSEGVFMHIKNLPVLFEQIKDFMPDIKAVACSKMPRREENSYMPVFVVGHSFAKAVSASLGIPLVETTHQEGHISAVMETTYITPDENFIAVHISGGTTEIVLCRTDNNGYVTEIIGKTLDIPAGQLIDRIGVLAGIDFPCGKMMDMVAVKGNIVLPVSVNGCNINFSGAETVAKRMLNKDVSHPELFYSLFDSIAKSLEKAIKNISTDYKSIVMVGGVAANKIINSHLTEVFGNKIYFTNPKYSTDNAIGTAYICKRKCLN